MLKEIAKNIISFIHSDQLSDSNPKENSQDILSTPLETPDDRRTRINLEAEARFKLAGNH
jgi:hypothetical protein